MTGLPLTNRCVVAAIPDLFFAARVKEVARASGTSLVLTAAGHVPEVAEVRKPQLVILELGGSAEVLDAARELKANPATRAIRVVGFYSHVDQETRRAAEAAGVDLVLPRSAFTARLAELMAGAAPEAAS